MRRGVLNVLRGLVLPHRTIMAEDLRFKEAIDAATQGQRSRARDLLTRLLKSDNANPTYWLWMSSVVDSPKEQIYCLQSVLRLDPQNQAARRGLVLLGKLPPVGGLAPVPPFIRKWQSLEDEALPTTRKKGLLFNPVLRASALALLGLLSIGLVLLGVFGLRAGPAGIVIGMRLTVTPQPWPTQPTATLMPTNTPRFPTATPTFTGPIPLWMLLDATYTATPFYVDTPHPISEAFRAGLRAFQHGDLEGMLGYMQQAAQVEPGAPDAHYYIGEAYRLMGNYEAAQAAYEAALAAEAGFAPAYLGRARTYLALCNLSSAAEDLDQAIQLDPRLAEAYLERAGYRIEIGEYETALEDLARLEKLQASSPLLHLFRAQAYLGLGKMADALSAAERAYDLDRTLLTAYLVLGQVYLWANMPEEASDRLGTYTRYIQDDALAWSALGQALHQAGGQTELAIAALDRALELDEELAGAYLSRGLVYLDLGEGQKAVNDLFRARSLDPDSFRANLGMGRALLMAGRPVDAARQLTSCEKLVEGDEQLAEVFYWRAQAYEESDERLLASQDWQALLALPGEVVPSTWAKTAQQSLFSLTPEPTSTGGRPSAPTSTPTLTETAPHKSPTPTRTPAAATRTPAFATQTITSPAETPTSRP